MWLSFNTAFNRFGREPSGLPLPPYELTTPRFSQTGATYFSIWQQVIISTDYGPLPIAQILNDASFSLLASRMYYCEKISLMVKTLK